MKNILLKSLAILLAAGSLASCKAFLEEVNPTGLTDVYRSETQLEADMNGIHSYMMIAAGLEENIGTCTGFWWYGSTGTTSYTNQRFVAALNLCQYSQVSENKDVYSRFYVIISRCNNLIAALASSPVDEAYKEELEAEALFTRAVAYLWLVAMYGDVPMWLESPKPENASNCPRTKYDQVYKQIIKDLLYAQDHMRSPQRVAELTPNTARPNKFAATAYLSTAYTYIGSLLSHPDDNFWDTSKPERLPDFQTGWPEGAGVSDAAQAYTKALAYAEKLLPESSSHDPECTYKLVDKIQHLFTYDHSVSFGSYTSFKNDEMIYTYLSSMSNNNSNTWSRNLLPNLAPGTTAPSASNCNRTRPTRFIVQKWMQTYPGKKGSGTTANIYVTSTDPRVEATLYCSQYTNSAGTVVKPYPVQISNTKEYVYSSSKKYWSKDYLAAYYTDASVHYMRLAEVYLNAAEAAAYLEKNDVALTYMGVLHKRARHSVADGKSDSTQPSWNGREFADKNELMVAIFWDRIFELLGEGQEFIDTHRFGATWLAEVVAKPLNDHLMESEQSGFFNNKFFAGAQRRIFCEDATQLRKSLIIPIPLDEINTNFGIPSAANDFWWGL